MDDSDGLWEGETRNSMQAARLDDDEDISFIFVTYMSCNLLSFLLRCGTRTYEWGTQWNSNSLVKASLSSLLTITPPEAPYKYVLLFFQFTVY